MHSRFDRTAQLATLARQIHEGTISRRAFIGRALALGLSLSAADTIFRTYRAGAQDQAENPITVTVGGTPIAAIEPDLSNATPGGTLRFGRAEDSDNLDPGDQRWQRQYLVLHEHLRSTGARGRGWHLVGARVGRELGYLRRRPHLYLPSAPECRLLRWDADDFGRRPLLLGPRGERSGATLDLHTHRAQARRRWAGRGDLGPGRCDGRRRAGAAVGAFPLRRGDVQHVGYLQGVRRRTRGTSRPGVHGDRSLRSCRVEQGRIAAPGEKPQLLGRRSATARRGRRRCGA